MRVLITGGAGLIGRAVASRLHARGDEVRLIDTAPPETLTAPPRDVPYFPFDVSNLPYTVCDILNFDELAAHMHGCDAVVHMAAVRNPFYAAGHDLFRINTSGTFNVFEAAAKNGICRVVQASSINALGCAWNLGDFSPRYFPVDEDHPSFTTDPYSFAKEQIEAIGAYFWRRDGISSTALRFPGVYAPPAPTATPTPSSRRTRMLEFLRAFSALPDHERQSQIDAVHQQTLAFRAARSLEYPAVSPWSKSSETPAELLWNAYALDRYNLWAWIDVRDAAQAVEKSLTAAFTGSHVLFVSDRFNFLDYDSHELARLFFPEVSEWRQPISGSESLVSNRRARDLIGFESVRA
ncbi:MAG: NAD(P)-dependent oxidoreductase [Anaerolineae bacterium]